ncbi:DUF6115 domain-containing protein [Alkalihalobacterium elongatum]|uniref:DUF6115 domain-containing protein n=1 Tax=Alkalihalobacterium elongatum TaxID=2675466 RepID=UPI001C1FB0A6|nr:hypothetical protein [Alkalihalobacterium elongatum]
MVQFLITTSLVLHLLTFLWIVTLLQKINNQQAPQIDEEKIKREIEDLLVAYTAEIKEENERVLEQIKLSKQKASQAIIENKQPFLNRKDAVVFKTEEQSIPSNTHTVYGGYVPPEIKSDETDMYVQSTTAQVLSLSKQGLSTDEIAKKLNLGKGEVELMIKFYQ